MTIYVIANYKMQMTLTKLEVFYDSKTASEVHNQRKKEDPEGEHWLHFLENTEELSDIPLVRREKE